MSSAQSQSQASLDAGCSGDRPMTASGARSRSSSVVEEGRDIHCYQLPAFQAATAGSGLTPSSALSSLFSLDPPAGSVMKFGCTGTITPATGTSDYMSSMHYQLQQPHHTAARAAQTALGPMSYLMHADTPPIPANSILFSPAGLPPRHQPTLDYAHPASSMDYFTLISPSGTMQSLPQQQQPAMPQYPVQQAAGLSQSYPVLIRPADTLLGSVVSSSFDNNRPKLAHLAPLPMQGALTYQQQQQHHFQPQQTGWSGPFSQITPAQPSNLSNSITASGNGRTHTHQRGISVASSSFTSTSSSSLSMDSLTWSPTGSPTSSSHSLASSFQPQESFMTQSLTDRAPSPNPPYPIQAASAQQHQGKILPSYTYGHPVDHVPQQQQQFPPSMFDARYQKEEQTLPNQASNVYNQVSSEMYGFDQQQYLKQPDFSTMLRDSISPVQMSLSPPQANEDTQMSTLRPPSQQGGIGGITPTRSNFTLIAPTPRVPSLMAKAVEALDADVASPESMMTSSPDGGHSEEEAESKADVKLVEKPTGEIRQLRRGRSGGQLSLSSLAQQQQQSSTQLQQQRQRTMIQTNHRSAHEALPAMQQQPAIVLPSKIKALGTLPADEAFSASLDQLEDVPHGTKPPYLWWTLIRAAILGAPEQKLQMETLTHLIQQKYPYFGSAKEARNWKSSIRSVIHTKPCFYKSEDESGNVWWHVDADIDPREQRRGMKKRSSLSSGSGTSLASNGDTRSNSSSIIADAVAAVKNVRKLHPREDDDENEDEEEELDIEGEHDDFEEVTMIKQSSSRKRRKSG